MGRFIRDWLFDLAARRPDDEAVGDAERRWTYADLKTATLLVAASLQAAGVEARARVAVLTTDGTPAVALIHAVRHLGAVHVPLSRRAAAGELGFQVAASGARVLVHDRSQSRQAAAVQAEATGLALLEVDDLLAGRVRADKGLLLAHVDLDSPATTIFTSGTTGRPKGAVLTHRAHLASARAWAAVLQPRAGDRWLACLPLFHIAGLAIAIRASRWGVPLEVHPRFDPAAVVRALDRGVSHLSLVGPMLARLVDAAPDRFAPPTVRAVLVGGGPIDPAVALRARELRYPLVPTYGLTETASGVVALPPDAAPERWLTVGRPLPNVELRIEVEGRPAVPGEVGEIAVRAPMVFAGYQGELEESERALRDGWLHTGDHGVLDANGDLTIADRRDDLIVSGGEKVYPSEVEAALLAHPSVAEAVVVRRADSRWGSVPVAAIVLAPNASVTDTVLAAHCRSRLAGFKVPVAFYRLERLPGAPSSKLRRSAVRDLLRESGS